MRTLVDSRTENLKRYLMEAKEKNWCIDKKALSIQFNLTMKIVHDCCDEVYGKI